MARPRALKAPARLAVLSVGYADGYHRLAGASDEQPGARVWVRGQRAPLAGRVSMDLITIDVTHIPGVVRGDWVELFGRHIAVDEVARHAGTDRLRALDRPRPPLPAGLCRRAGLIAGSPRRPPKINLSPPPWPHERMRLSAPEKGSRVDRTFMGGAERRPCCEEVSDLFASGPPRRDRRHYDRPPSGPKPFSSKERGQSSPGDGRKSPRRALKRAPSVLAE